METSENLIKRYVDLAHLLYETTRKFNDAKTQEEIDCIKNELKQIDNEMNSIVNQVEEKTYLEREEVVEFLNDQICQFSDSNILDFK